MYGSCKMIYTDHNNIIICHVDDIHPIWIWTKDNMDMIKKGGNVCFLKVKKQQIRI